MKKIDKDILSYLDWAEVAPKNPAYACHNGAIYRREDAALQNVSGVFEIPEGVKKVGDKAFWCRRELTGVRVLAGVTELGENAFGGLEAGDAGPAQGTDYHRAGCLFRL